MLKRLFFGNYALLRRCINPPSRLISCTTILRKDKDNNDDESISSNILSKYEPFREDRSPIIFDVEEERKKQIVLQEEEELIDENYSEFHGISPERGESGVIEIEELVEILRKENAQNIFVCKVPPEYRYVDYMAIVSGKSGRHMLGMAEFVRKVFKYKMSGKDIIPSIEGRGSTDWIALDLGNIALHIFEKSKRLEYDLESLWSVGSELDTIANLPEDPVVKMLKDHSVLVGDLNQDITNQ